jgi:hypothetical protein
MTYNTQLAELIHLKTIITNIINKKDMNSKKILNHTQSHVTSQAKLRQIEKAQRTMKKKKSIVINSSGTSEELFQQILEAINENIYECLFYRVHEPNDYQLLVKSLSFPKGHDKQWYISMTNANAFEINNRPANCYIVSLSKCNKFNVMFGYDESLYKRGYKNDPQLLWTPKIISQKENVIQFELPLGPALGWPFYPHTSVNPLCGLHHYKQLQQLEK